MSVCLKDKCASCTPLSIIRRLTIEIDDELLARARIGLGCATTQATVEEALRRVADQGHDEAERRVSAQSTYLEQLGSMIDLKDLREHDMWR